jgi:hypothetical protein
VIESASELLMSLIAPSRRRHIGALGYEAGVHAGATSNVLGDDLAPAVRALLARVVH